MRGLIRGDAYDRSYQLLRRISPILPSHAVSSDSTMRSCQGLTGTGVGGAGGGGGGGAAGGTTTVGSLSPNSVGSSVELVVGPLPGSQVKVP